MCTSVCIRFFLDSNKSAYWYMYLYQFSLPLKDDCTLDRKVLYIWKYLSLIWRTPPCDDKWQIICASSAVFHFTPVVSMWIKAKCQKNEPVLRGRSNQSSNRYRQTNSNTPNKDSVSCIFKLIAKICFSYWFMINDNQI